MLPITTIVIAIFPFTTFVLKLIILFVTGSEGASAGTDAPSGGYMPSGECGVEWLG